MIKTWTDETRTQSDMGLQYSLKDCIERDYLFYNINALSEFVEDGITYTSVYCNGSEFTSPERLDEITSRIAKVWLSASIIQSNTKTQTVWRRKKFFWRFTWNA